MILPDTSVWICFFQKGSELDLSQYAPPEELWTTPPIVQEVLQGVRDDTVFDELREIFRNMRMAEEVITLEVYEEAARIYRLGRKKGVTIRSSVDCLVAAIAVRNELTVLHRDRDYPRIAGFTGLKCLEV